MAVKVGDVLYKAELRWNDVLSVESVTVVKVTPKVVHLFGRNMVFDWRSRVSTEVAESAATSPELAVKSLIDVHRQELRVAQRDFDTLCRVASEGGYI